MLLLRPVTTNHERRVTTVEEQQTQEDLEDDTHEHLAEECPYRDDDGHGSCKSDLSDESMPNNVSESDYHSTYRHGLTIGQVKSSLDYRSCSKLSGAFILNQDVVRLNVQSKMDNHTEEEEEAELENLSDENEEMFPLRGAVASSYDEST
jgi:hypothetical protein